MKWTPALVLLILFGNLVGAWRAWESDYILAAMLFSMFVGYAVRWLLEDKLSETERTM